MGYNKTRKGYKKAKKSYKKTKKSYNKKSKRSYNKNKIKKNKKGGDRQEWRNIHKDLIKIRVLQEQYDYDPSEYNLNELKELITKHPLILNYIYDEVPSEYEFNFESFIIDYNDCLQIFLDKYDEDPSEYNLNELKELITKHQ
jgi:hypothetical protein